MGKTSKYINAKAGIDIEKISRFELDINDNFIKFIFSEKEIKYASSKKNKDLEFCKIFCIKEAIIKTLDDQSIMFKDIILHNKGDRYLVEIKGQLKIAQIKNEQREGFLISKVLIWEEK